MFRRFSPRFRFWLLVLTTVLAVAPAGMAEGPRRNALIESLEAPMDIAGPGATLDLPAAGAAEDLLGGGSRLEAPAVETKPAIGPVVKAELHPLEGSSDTVVLQVKLEIPEKHYSYSQEKLNPIPTRITVEETPGLTPAEDKFAEAPAAHPYKDVALDKMIEKHEGTVIFSKKYTVTDPAKLPGTTLKGNVSLLMCREGNCTRFPKLPFNAAYIAVPVTLGAGSGESTMVVQSSAGGTLWSNLLLAFVGGIILNVMPCVLPVIGIKVVSFVEQSGENRFRIFALNWTYAAGSLFVFLILGTLAALFSMNSGQVFQSDYFKIVFAVVVFAMALSLLGVFELNLPGVATGFGLSNEKEGLIGAFISGVVATFLATPCIGPFMGPALGWSVGQPVPVIYAIWMSLGLGMSFPYLILGLAPRLISWLPRPGMWMVRFKQFSGFLLLATVLFLIQPLERRARASAPAADAVPAVVDANSSAPDLMHSAKPEVSKPLTGVLIALLGLGIGLWMIGNLYNHASTPKEKWKVRIAALMITAPVMWYGVADQFGWRLLPSHELAWEDWSEARMNSHLADGKPVLIDFTADWCTTCKFNEATALNIAATKKFVEENHFVAMKADFTEESPEIKKWLTKFKAGGVPLYVIFPPGDSSAPIAFEGLLTKSLILSKLEEAVKRGKASTAKADGNATALIERR